MRDLKLPNLPSGIRHVLLVLALGTIFYFGLLYFRKTAEDQAYKWLGPELQRLQGSSQLTFSPSQPELNDARVRLAEQYSYIRRHARLHLEVLIFYYARYYMAIVMATLLTLLSALCLAFISRKGWASANEYLVTCFIVFAASAAFFGAYPALYRQADNVEDNKGLYIAYIALENTLRSNIALWNSGSDARKKLDDLVLNIDKDLAKLNDLPFAIDPGAVKGLKDELTSIGTEPRPAE